MRTYFLTSLAAAGLALARKSLGFGPVLPQAGLRTPDAQAFARDVNADPFGVAEALVRGLTAHDFVRRSDSYTDAATGVSHVYFRQRVNGVEVADGDINVNVKDGLVLSYGNSFYDGPEPSSSAAPLDPRREYCEALQQHLTQQHFAQQPGTQTPLGTEDGPHPLSHLLESNCAYEADAPAPELLSGNIDDRMSQALLRFMLAASLDTALTEDIRANFLVHRRNMAATPSAQVLGTGANYHEVENVPGAVSPVKARLAYVQVPQDGKTVLSLVWKFEVEMTDNWYEAAVSAEPPHHIMSVVDWASDAYAPVPKRPFLPKYNVFPWGINDPTAGNRSVVQYAPDTLASPAGWHALQSASDPFHTLRASANEWRNATTTAGNNVLAQENWAGGSAFLDNHRPDGGAALMFDFPYEPRAAPAADARAAAKEYIDAAVTQLFVTSNLVHDLFYRYGFDERAGNFQQHNFGRGGRGGDAVVAHAQDGAGLNNADFMTPPDGQSGRCRMYLFNTADPYRDGDLEAGVLIHELAHGLSNRLTGGPADASCLGWGESGGMGEGWGDFIATTVRATKGDHDYTLGAWVSNRPGGIRNYPFSTNDTVNPSTYKTLDRPAYWEIHSIGEVWAEMLWVVSQRLVAKHGFSATLFPPQPLADGTVPEGDFYRPRESSGAPLVPKHGNTLMLQLVITGMKLQPCRPSLFDARDAIVQADQVLTGGENACDLWHGFASRGLGVDATVVGRLPFGGGVRTDGHRVPADC